MSQFDWPIKKKEKKKVRLWRVPKIEDSTERYWVPALWPHYVGEKARTLDKTYGIKARCYWEHPWGTHWELREHIENLIGT
jgi:hypothetical protein